MPDDDEIKLNRCLMCNFEIQLDQAEVKVRSKHKNAQPSYHHSSQEDCQNALRTAEQVVHPSAYATPGLIS